MHTQRPGSFKSNVLGFTRFLMDVAYLEKVAFFYNFRSFGGIRSTQPTGRYGFFKIDTYGAVLNITIGVNLGVFRSIFSRFSIDAAPNEV